MGKSEKTLGRAFLCTVALLYFQINLSHELPSTMVNEDDEVLLGEFLKNISTGELPPEIKTVVDFALSEASEAQDEESILLRKENTVFRNNKSSCTCVKFFQCDVDDETSAEGADVDTIDIRSDRKIKSECDHYLDICCNNLKQPVKSELTKVETPSKSNTCGIRNPSGVGFRIIGDIDGESQFGEFPWMAAITRVGDQKHKYVYVCGGSLIHPKVVLTAAHCVNKYEANKLRVRLGEWDTQTDKELLPFQDRRVTKVVIHEEFSAAKYLINDIALLFLDDSVNLAPNVATICLTPFNVNFENQRCFVSGWGKDSYEQDGAYQVIMKRVEIPVVNRDTCQTALARARLGNRFQLHDSFVCAGGELGKDSCKGDGGSPLVCQLPNSQSYTQYGIVSWGLGCGQESIPGVYVNVQKFYPWIEQNVLESGLNTTSYTP